VSRDFNEVISGAELESACREAIRKFLAVPSESARVEYIRKRWPRHLSYDQTQRRIDDLWKRLEKEKERGFLDQFDEADLATWLRAFASAANLEDAET
jgi:hypothetical protein